LKVVRARRNSISPASATSAPISASPSASAHTHQAPPAGHSRAAGTARASQAITAAQARSITGGGIRCSYQRLIAVRPSVVLRA